MIVQCPECQGKGGTYCFPPGVIGVVDSEKYKKACKTCSGKRLVSVNEEGLNKI